LAHDDEAGSCGAEEFEVVHGCLWWDECGVVNNPVGKVFTGFLRICGVMDLFKYTYDLVRQVPAGHVTSYGAVASALGDLLASRAVGRMMNQNPHPESMPCFKVVHSDGRLGGFGLGLTDKVRRLKEDHVLVRDGHVVDFQRVFFNEFATEFPLRALRREQVQLGMQVRVEDDFGSLETVAGIDVAYPHDEFAKGVGAFVAVDVRTGAVVEEQTVSLGTCFPFIPTFFSYREVPFVEALLKRAATSPSVVLLDGQGILHPVRCGFASHAGVVCDVPTVGVAKSRLYGSVEGKNIVADGEVRGVAVCSGSARRPLFVSPGHRVSLESCEKIVRQVSRTKHPEPLRLAHLLAARSLREELQVVA
jgi:deoxyribonuclease V